MDNRAIGSLCKETLFEGMNKINFVQLFPFLSIVFFFISTTRCCPSPNQSYRQILAAEARGAFNCNDLFTFTFVDHTYNFRIDSLAAFMFSLQVVLVCEYVSSL